MKLSLLASTLFVAAGLASPLQEVRKRVQYRFEGIDEYYAKDKAVTDIVKEDTGTDLWICTRSLPPICNTPPMSQQGIEKLEALGGVIITIIALPLLVAMV